MVVYLAKSKVETIRLAKKESSHSSSFAVVALRWPQGQDPNASDPVTLALVISERKHGTLGLTP